MIATYRFYNIKGKDPKDMMVRQVRLTPKRVYVGGGAHPYIFDRVTGAWLTNRDTRIACRRMELLRVTEDDALTIIVETEPGKREHEERVKAFERQMDAQIAAEIDDGTVEFQR